MSHSDPLNGPETDSENELAFELENIEQMLGNLELAPSEVQKTEILLACGRAEGREEARQSIRRLKAGLATFAGTTACLLGMLLLGSGPSESPRSDANATNSIAESEPNDPDRGMSFSPRTPVPETKLPQTKFAPQPDRSALTVSSKWSRWQRFSRPENDASVSDMVADSSTQIPLTASSRLILNELLD